VPEETEEDRLIADPRVVHPRQVSASYVAIRPSGRALNRSAIVMTEQ
jgi:hypothetical protein